MKRWALIGAVAAVVLLTPVWLPALGSGLAEDEPLATSDVALVMEGAGTDALQAAEGWRQSGLVKDVVIVEAPVKTHALVTYWSDLVARGIAAAAPTPAEHLRIVRASSTLSIEQARAVLPTLQQLTVHSVAVLGGGGIGTRLVGRDLRSVLDPAGISVRLVRYGGGAGRNPASWYTNADDRRAVLDSWLRLLVPYLSTAD